MSLCCILIWVAGFFENYSVMDILNQNKFLLIELLPVCMGKAGQTSSGQCIIQYALHLRKSLYVRHLSSATLSPSSI